MALGREPPHFEGYRAGTFYVRHAAEAIGCMGDLESIAQRGRMRSSALGDVEAGPPNAA